MGELIMNKEWKGNSNSAHAAIVAKRPNSTNVREQDDFYATDPKALEAFLVSEKISAGTWGLFENCKRDSKTSYQIWECAAGNGNLSNWLREHGYNIIATDLKERGSMEYGILSGVDFLNTFSRDKFGAAHNIAIILTNPPYSLANEFILHALDILLDGGLYIALMNITYLAGQKRYREIYSKGCLREVYVFSKRIECWKNGERPKDKCGSIANYAWYVFQKGYKGQPTLYWL